MVLLDNQVLLLTHGTAGGFLVMEIRQVKSGGLKEVQTSWKAVARHVARLEVDALLVDSSRADIEMADDLYRALLAQFSIDLKRAGILWLARVGGAKPVLEQRASQVAGLLLRAIPSPIAFQTFTGREEALHWLINRKRFASPCAERHCRVAFGADRPGAFVPD